MLKLYYKFNFATEPDHLYNHRDDDYSVFYIYSHLRSAVSDLLVALNHYEIEEDSYVNDILKSLYTFCDIREPSYETNQMAFNNVKSLYKLLMHDDI
ncbi:hypothetical protein K4P61_11505 [Staphylococcus epidermidis]|uniref:hypothetical protein n=1 Tax=Staphylococcus epidermidis TaxID=1282 RepID=UPI0024AD8ACD|nr:hypothetical protein [Staphylococcus epidermidis]MCG1382428.1 hypothetical protein [Staphylococcus epidermidis]WHI63889.1 hypothetical protein PYH64_12380 [Staphylococcus epidermidis]